MIFSVFSVSLHAVCKTSQDEIHFVQHLTLVKWTEVKSETGVRFSYKHLTTKLK